MVIFFILLVLILAALILISLFSPQKLPWYRPHLNFKTSEFELSERRSVSRQSAGMEGAVEPEGDFNIPLEENVARLENILNEKNRFIERLQRELAAEKGHRTEFEKVKAILDDEIKNLRSQNKELKVQKGDGNE
ncbi:MAG: hypothetical protein WCH62_07325 [Candidatus Omnitrophota bacterium]